MALDDSAVAQIYLEHAPMLRRVVWRATGDPAQVEDIVQETILRVWRKAPDTDNLRAYLIATARHLIVDRYRAAGRRPREVALCEPGGGVTSELDHALDQVLVEEALARLQPDHRTVIRCLYYERLTVAESARRLGIPEGTVKSRAFYAVRSLRDILDEMGVTR